MMMSERRLESFFVFDRQARLLLACMVVELFEQIVIVKRRTGVVHRRRGGGGLGISLTQLGRRVTSQAGVSYMCRIEEGRKLLLMLACQWAILLKADGLVVNGQLRRVRAVGRSGRGDQWESGKAGRKFFDAQGDRGWL